MDFDRLASRLVHEAYKHNQRTALSNFGVTGCDDDKVTEPESETAQVRVQHLFPDAAGVDVYATLLATNAHATRVATSDQGTTPDPIKVFENVDYRESSAFAEVSAGSYKIDVTLTGDPIGDAVLTIPSIDFDRDVAYTAVAWDDGSGIAALPLVDDLSDPGAGVIRVRAIHLANTIGQVDIWNVTDPNDPIPVWTDLDTGGVGAHVVVPNQAATLGFDVNDDALVDVFFDVPALPTGTILNAFASIDSSDALFLHAQMQDGTTVSVDPAQTDLCIVHGSPSAGAVDVYANAAVQLVQNFQFTDGRPSTPVVSVRCSCWRSYQTASRLELTRTRLGEDTSPTQIDYDLRRIGRPTHRVGRLPYFFQHARM